VTTWYLARNWYSVRILKIKNLAFSETPWEIYRELSEIIINVIFATPTGFIGNCLLENSTEDREMIIHCELWEKAVRGIMLTWWAFDFVIHTIWADLPFYGGNGKWSSYPLGIRRIFCCQSFFVNTTYLICNSFHWENDNSFMRSTISWRKLVRNFGEIECSLQM